MIKQLHLQNFTCFVDNQFEFCQGINVFIGENGTGKTHLLKVLGSFGFWANLKKQKNEHQLNLGEASAIFFDVNEYKELRYNWQKVFSLQINDVIFADFVENSEKFDADKVANFLFIPSHEILTYFKGFTALYEKSETGFEHTEYLLCKSLSVPLLKKESNPEVYQFVEDFEAILQAKIIQKNGSFYFHFYNDNEPTPINLVAEGWRKIATYIYLILNGELELNDKMVLLIDEPEANLNPALIETMAAFLNKLASKGVQIFLSTHNQLLPNYLSWNTDFKTENSPATRFFGLSRLANNSGIGVEMADSVYNLQNNPILDAALHQHEQKDKKIAGQFKKNKF